MRKDEIEIFLQKVDEAKERLEETPHYPNCYYVDSVLINRLFEIAYTIDREKETIPIEWLEKCKDRYILCCTIIDDIIEEWRSGYEPD